MARLAATGRKASPLFAAIGPSPVQASAHGLDPARVLAEHRAWREEFLDAWERGERVPEPPYAEQLDSFARPAA